MKTPVRFSRGRLKYTGRIAPSSFARWAESSEGRATLEEISSSMRFRLFGRMRAARRRVWRHLERAARSEMVATALQREADRYLGRLDALACARDLPRLGVDLRRLVVVPRMFVNGDAFRGIDDVLRVQPAFASLNNLGSLRSWFVISLIESMETAAARARPSPSRPIAAGPGWITVGVNEQFEWSVPITGPTWPGHYYVLELRRVPITAAVRKGTSEAIASLERSLPSLSRVRRQEIVRQAALSVIGFAA